MKLLAGPARTTSPAETTSFSFGNKQDGEVNGGCGGDLCNQQLFVRSPWVVAL